MLFFILCTIIELHLIINWYIFFICLFVEVSLLCRGDRQRNIMVALSGVLVGLALNLFFQKCHGDHHEGTSIGV